MNINLRKTFQSALAFAAAAVLSACGGGGGGLGHSALPATQSSPGATVPQSVAALSIKIPARTTQSVSPSTQSLVIKQGATTLGTFNTTPTTAGCSSVNGSTQCVFTLGVPVGSITLSVSAYDAVNGGGSLLSTGSVTQTMVAGQNNAIPLTMGGVVSAIAVGVGSVPAGTSATVPVSVMAKDVDGNVIIGPGNYTQPITLSNTDTSGTTTLSSTTVTSPSTSITLAYNGDSLLNATIGASATGVSSTTPGNFAPTFANIPDPSGHAFAFPSGGESAAITYNPAPGDGNIWVAECCGAPSGAIAKVNPSTGVITEFVGGVTPGLSPDNYNGIGPDNAGNLWFTESNDKIGRITPAGVVTEFGGLTAGANPLRLVFVPSDNAFWFTENSYSGCCSSLPNKVGRISLAGAVTEFALPGGGYFVPNDILLGKDGKLYVSEYGYSNPGQIVQITIGSNVSASPVIFMPAGVSSAFGLMQSADGDLWVTTDSCNSPDSLYRVTGFSANFSSGTVTAFPIDQSCASAYFGTATADNQVFFGEDSFPLVGRGVIPAGHGTPVFSSFAFPSRVAQGYSGDATVGPHGHIWVTNYNTPGNLNEYAY